MRPKKSDPFWFKDAIFYELNVRSFYDSNGDGIGDFQGLILKLDYLDELGIDTIWLLPFYPSPQKDDGYDVTDHYDVHPDLGTLADFKQFLKEAHRRGIRVVTELILNHTSDQHAWFRKAKKARAGTRFRDFYVWSDTPDKYADARVIFPKEEESNWTFDEEADAYYWHRYHAHQPELNYANPEVHLEMIRIADFWLRMGVDGFRLPSVTFLYEQEGTDCENLPQTHAFLKKLRAHIDKNYRDRILIAEANLWPEDAATYFGDGDECHMNFHYPLMPRLFLALRTEDSYPITDIVEQTPKVPENCQWALFLRNHDELGLEMVSEEEKDFLFKAYATDRNTKFNVGIRRRLAPLLNNDRRKIELLHVLLFSLPGTPVMYYGDEIGMGDNVYLGDRFGVRTPMQWDFNLNAGFSTANPQRLVLPIIQDPEYRQESVNVALASGSSTSLLAWLKQLITTRRNIGVLGRGQTTFIESSNSRVLAFSRYDNDRCVIVVANLSQFAQATVLDFSRFKGWELREVFGQNEFMKPTGKEYPLTLSPYGYFWIQAEPPNRRETTAGGELALIKTNVSWEKIFENYNEVRFLERHVLPPFMKKCRWFGGKAKAISKVTVETSIPLRVEGDTHFLLIVEVQYAQRLPESYFLPITFVSEQKVGEQVEYATQSVVCRALIQGESGFVMDSSYDRVFRDFLFSQMRKNSSIRGVGDGVLEFKSGVFVKPGMGTGESRILKADQSNTAIVYGDQYFFKFYRKVEREMNPDLEIVRFLTENTSFRNSPRYAGSIQFKDADGDPIVLGLLQEMVQNRGDAWVMTLESLGNYYDRVLALPRDAVFPPLIDQPVLSYEQTPAMIQELIGKEFCDRVTLLGRRTAEMHKAIASNNTDPAFAPDKVAHHDQRSFYSSLRRLVKDRFGLLEDALPRLDGETKRLASEVLAASDSIMESFERMRQVRISAIKTRIHGDYHLGQVLFTGEDFVIIDFEGEPGLSFTERRRKRSPFKDVAGMMRSFHYAAYGKILLKETYHGADQALLEKAAEQWQHYVSRLFLGAYLEYSGLTGLSGENSMLIRTFLLEKAIYELGYELNNRPDWINVPLRGIQYLVMRYRNETG